jgi:hypothetical protein
LVGSCLFLRQTQHVPFEQFRLPVASVCAVQRRLGTPEKHTVGLENIQTSASDFWGKQIHQHGLAYPRHISSARIFRAPRVPFKVEDNLDTTVRLDTTPDAKPISHPHSMHRMSPETWSSNFSQTARSRSIHISTGVGLLTAGKKVTTGPFP